MKKILSYICILISFAVATDHAPLNISPRLELIGQTTRCTKISHHDDDSMRWICVNSMRYRDVPSTYMVEVDFTLNRWEISYSGYSSVNTDTTMYSWRYILSIKDTTISEYQYHFVDTTRVVDNWRKGKVHYERFRSQIYAFRAFTENLWTKQ